MVRVYTSIIRSGLTPKTLHQNVNSALGRDKNTRAVSGGLPDLAVPGMRFDHDPVGRRGSRYMREQSCTARKITAPARRSSGFMWRLRPIIARTASPGSRILPLPSFSAAPSDTV